MRTKRKEKFASFEQAKAFVKSVNIKSKKEYYVKCREFREQGVICLPASPARVYKDKWISWPDYLCKNKGTMSVAARRGAVFFDYEKAKKFIYEYAVNNNIQFHTSRDFKNFAKTEEFINNISKFIPIAPDAYYKKTGDWNGWSDFLSVYAYNVMSYDEMKQVFAENKISNMDQMFEFCASHPEYNISDNIEESCKMLEGRFRGWEGLFYSEPAKQTEIDFNSENIPSESLLRETILLMKKLLDCFSRVAPISAQK